MMKILYMNQGVNGGWGAIKYSSYDIVCLAESDQSKQGFELAWKSTDSDPVMSIQQKEGTRTIINAKDLDKICQSVRPMMTFTIKGSPVRVVFVHLKSGNQKLADDALQIAISELQIQAQTMSNRPVLWIGDFNRATPSALNQAFSDAKCIHAGGGHSKWDLDRVYISGPWKEKPAVDVVSISSADHGHQGLAVSL
ncbi:endonuclease/exonuclease/phosphatase family protein [Hahella ganghwensis]|uniref:endonuclease/exonuclease/phosphatase family protein n=1 Tax=Hahella ganghwensis TaxID=286420 RepID=UPI0012FB40FD|nr:endonuclease/exonuclease/phosphatase family protein [Hahella ganghwensis]